VRQYLNGGYNLNEPELRARIEAYHRKRNLPVPVITFVDSPLAAHKCLAGYVFEKWETSIAEKYNQMSQLDLLGGWETFKKNMKADIVDVDQWMFNFDNTHAYYQSLILTTGFLDALKEQKPHLTYKELIQNELYSRKKMAIDVPWTSPCLHQEIILRIIFRLQSLWYQLMFSPQSEGETGLLFHYELFRATYWFVNSLYRKFYMSIGVNYDNEVIDLYASGIFSGVVFKDFWVLIRMPTKTQFEVNMDYNWLLERHFPVFNFHSTTGKALEFSDGHGYYCVEGRVVAPELFEPLIAGQYTKEQFIAETNAETRAVVYSILGTEKLMNLLQASELDSHTFHHLNGDVEVVTLYKTAETFEELENQPLAWVRFVCPSTGHNYLIDVEPHHISAKLAALSTSPLFTSEADYRFTDRA
jgi:hypothetical protein